MLQGSGTKVLIDQLFNILLIIVVMLFLSVISMKDSEEQKKTQNADNDNNLLITMKWPTNNDMDLWLRLPDGRLVGYPSRDKPPAHLDVDVVAWRRYQDETGQESIIDSNEEIITVRGILEGEYTINTFYYNDGGFKDQTVETEVTVQDVKSGNVVFSGKKPITKVRTETHFVKFTVRRDSNSPVGYVVEEIYTDRPRYFLKELSQQQQNSFPGG